MVVRQFFSLVLEQQGKMQGVARPPDAALAVDKALEAFIQDSSAYVKTAQRVLLAALYAKVAYALAFTSGNGEGLAALDGYFCQAAAAGLAAADLLQLVVVNCNLYS